MRIAALYDIHGNLPALEAVLDEVSAENVNTIVIGGDVVAGPLPVETINLLRSLSTPTHFIHGNAESETVRFLAGKPVNGLSPRADAEARWVAETLPDNQKAFIATWKMTVQLGDMLFCHATPHSDLPVFTVESADQRLRDCLFPLPENVNTVVCGHTHMQFERIVDGVRVVNAGSVGAPFVKVGAFWLLIDGDAIDFRRTEYERHAAGERIRQSNYPDAEQVAKLIPPSEADVMTMLRHLESIT